MFYLPIHAMTRFTLLLFGLVLLSGCARYSVSVNERLVYTPEPLFKDYRIADEPLRNCVEQTIKDGRITRAAELRRLNCSSAGIANLAGLERFHALEEINLPGNQLTQVPELARLSQLRILILRDNDLVSAAPLLSLLQLERLDLSENPNLPCTDLPQLARTLGDNGGRLIKPQHCAE